MKKLSQTVLDKLVDCNLVSGTESVRVHDLVLDIINPRVTERQKEDWHARLLDT